MIPLIGPRWLAETRRRLDDPTDWVRLQLQAALAHPGVNVIPVLVDRAEMPHPDELPGGLAHLASIHALQFAPATFSHNLSFLIAALEAVAEEKRSLEQDTTKLRITLTKGDITEQNVDAIVNAANSTLMVGGGGVDGAIHANGGPAILEECKRIRAEQYPDGLPAGQAVATTAGRLPAKWVIHTVGPVYWTRVNRSDLLASCHVQALRVADELGAKSVAFPAISTGAFGYPVEEAAPVAIRAVREASTKVELVRFVLFDQPTYDAFGRALQETAGV